MYQRPCFWLVTFVFFVTWPIPPFPGVLGSGMSLSLDHLPCLSIGMCVVGLVHICFILGSLVRFSSQVDVVLVSLGRALLLELAGLVRCSPSCLILFFSCLAFRLRRSWLLQFLLLVCKGCFVLPFKVLWTPCSCIIECLSHLILSAWLICHCGMSSFAYSSLLILFSPSCDGAFRCL